MLLEQSFMRWPSKVDFIDVSKALDTISQHFVGQILPYGLGAGVHGERGGGVPTYERLDLPCCQTCKLGHINWIDFFILKSQSMATSKIERGSIPPQIQNHYIIMLNTYSFSLGRCHDVVDFVGFASTWKCALRITPCWLSLWISLSKQTWKPCDLQRFESNIIRNYESIII